MTSPALRHRQKKLAQIAAEQAGIAASAGLAPDMPGDGPVGTEYRQLLASLHEDLRVLHTIQSKEAKAVKKADLITTYLPWIEGALAIEEDAAAPQDEIVITMMIWAVDIRDWDLAERLAAHVLAHNLQMPERFHRGAAGYVVSEAAKAALDTPGSVPHDVLERIEPLSEPPHDMTDEIRARLQRVLGESFARLADAFDPTVESATAGGKPALIEKALSCLKRALELDDKVGVKKPIEQLEREAKKLAEAAAAQQT